MSNEKESLSSTNHDTPPQLPDAPPAYSETINTLSSLTRSQGSIRLSQSPTSNASPPPFRPPAPPARAHTRSLSSSSVSSLKSKKSWFAFSSSGSTSTATRPPNEIRSTVLNLVRDLVQDHSSGSPAALGILQSCADACTSHAVSLSEILQDKYIESHSPLYWAIVKRSRTEEPQPQDDSGHEHEPEQDLLSALLDRAAPLSGATTTELRLACLATSDQAMFQRLRLLPQFKTVSGTDQIILGGALPPDDVKVELGPGTEGAFAATFEIPQFHKRIMISKEIRLEFVARNRIWRFSLLITPDGAWYGPPPGSWCAALSLQEPSPPTWLDARLVLPDTQDARPPQLRLKSKQMMEAPRKDVPATQVVVAIDDNPAFASLQYSGSSYVSAEETLKLRLDAKLRKPDTTSI